jgi:Arc/MetJ-type ribon-helix-helix transcriptional regulator
MVSVRLSEDEYVALRELCNTTGARSVSDVTRDAMRAFLSGSAKEEAFEIRFNEFCDRMSDLGRRLDELMERIASPDKPAEP